MPRGKTDKKRKQKPLPIHAFIPESSDIILLKAGLLTRFFFCAFPF